MNTSKIFSFIFLFLCLKNVVKSQVDSSKVINLDTSKIDKLRWELTINVNEKPIDDRFTKLTILNKNTGVLDKFKTTGVAVLNLEFNCIYEVSIGRKNTETKTIVIDTHAPKYNWYIISEVGLSTSKKRKKIKAGSLVYDSVSNDFVPKKLE